MSLPRLSFPVALVAGIVVILAGCGRSARTSMIGGGGSVSGDGWWFSSGNIFLQPEEPGVLFGMEKAPDGNRVFSYVMILRDPYKGHGGDVHSKNSDVKFSGTVASLRDGFTIDGKSFEVAVELETDKSTNTIIQRRLTINGEDADPAKGNLFLVDLTSDGVKYTQLSATLPDRLPDPTNDTQVVAKLARQVTQTLKKENAAVREFLEQ